MARTFEFKGLFARRPMAMLVFALCVFSVTISGQQNDPDDYSTAVKICDGSRPAITIDQARGIVHLAYVHDNKVWYRQGNSDGVFGAAEEVFVGNGYIFQPTVVVDDDGVPHIVACDGSNIWRGHYIYYMNRIGGSWSSKFQVINVSDVSKNIALNSYMTIQNNSAYIVSFVLLAPNADGSLGPKNMHTRLDNIDSSPVIGKKDTTRYFSTNFPWINQDDQLWIFSGASRPSWSQEWIMQQHDKSTLQPIGSEIMFLKDHEGEQIRFLYDHRGEVHAAGAAHHGRNPDYEGWYQTLSRVEDGLPPIKHSQSNIHASGAAQPVRDRVADNRVYVFYWHGAQSLHGEFTGCKTANHINFMRVENGEKTNEGQAITNRTASHGISYRAGPAAEAHPQGGVVVVFPECEANTDQYYTGSSELYFCHIGVKSATPVQNRRVSESLHKNVSVQPVGGGVNIAIHGFSNFSGENAMASIFGPRGQRVARFSMEPGRTSYLWDGLSEKGNKVRPGAYIIKINSGNAGFSDVAVKRFIYMEK